MTYAKGLLPCPFCGKDDSATVESSYAYQDYDESVLTNAESWQVVCDASNPNGKGGCGASGGFYSLQNKAIEAWNRRAGNAGMPRAAEIAEYKRLVEKMLVMLSQSLGPMLVQESEPNPIKEWMTEANKAIRAEASQPKCVVVDLWRDRAMQLAQMGDGESAEKYWAKVDALIERNRHNKPERAAGEQK